LGDIKLYLQSGERLTVIPGESYSIEKTLQVTIERNLQTLFGVRFLASEYSTGKTHGGRIDTLGLDENGSPVIIEYKRAANENVINQGLYYLDWLMDHKAEFQILVAKQIGQDEVDNIDWDTARLICIANQFLKYDEYAVKQIARNIELFQYKKFGKDMLLLELVNTTSASPDTIEDISAKKSNRTDASFTHRFSKLDKEQMDWFEELRHFTLALGDDVKEKQLKLYIAFARITNFMCVEVHPSAKTIVIYLKLDPTSFQIEEGLMRDVTNIGHYGTGDLEITIDSKEGLAKSFSYITKAYERN
jgi:predicted transport protein